MVTIDRERLISEKQNNKASPTGARLPKEAMLLRDIFKFTFAVAVKKRNKCIIMFYSALISTRWFSGQSVGFAVGKFALIFRSSCNKRL